MSTNDFLCLAAALLMLIFGFGWGLAGQALGLSRSASLGWTGFCLFCALTGFFSMEAAGLPDAAYVGLRNTCLTAALMLLRQGLLHFLNEPPRHREHLLLLALVMLVSVADGAGLLMASLRVVVISAVMCWIVLASGAGCAGPVRREFGRLAVGIMACTMASAAALFAWRAIWAINAWLHGVNLAASMNVTPALVISLLLLAAAFNLSLFYLVLTRLTRQLRHLASRDPLTDLLNRRSILEAIAEEHARLQRGGQGCALLAIDVDHFKQVNDTHGHAVGDQALRTLAGVMTKALRENDAAGRIGGEEFLLLLRMTGREGALLVADRIRSALAQMGVAGPASTLPVTVSIGALAVRSGCAQSVDAWLLHADEALYRAKELGRNRIEFETLE